MSSPLLSINHVTISFGGLVAVNDFDHEIPKGALEGLIGPNGAGKTTLFNLMTGVYKPDSGTIKLGDEVLNTKKPYQIAQTGVSRTFQNIRLFHDMSVLQNVQVAQHQNKSHSILSSVLRTPGFYKGEAEMKEKAMELLHIFGLADRADEYSCNLPYGDQRRLEIARALATEPKLLLLDEPAAGMNTGEKKGLANLIQQIRDQFDLTILLIEHDMSLVMDICEKITVVEYGIIIAKGNAAEIQSNPKVIEAYLGADLDDEPPVAVEAESDKDSKEGKS